MTMPVLLKWSMRRDCFVGGGRAYGSTEMGSAPGAKVAHRSASGGVLVRRSIMDRREEVSELAEPRKEIAT